MSIAAGAGSHGVAGAVRAEVVTLQPNDQSPRIPPQAIEAEQAILGGLLLDNSAWDAVTQLVSEQDLYRADHRLIFSHVGRIIRRGRPADTLTVAESLERAGKLADIGGQAYLGSLALNTPSAANIRRYAEIVAERSKLRKLISIAQGLQDRAYGPGIEIDELRDRARIELDTIETPGRRTGYLDLAALAAREPQQPRFPLPDWAPAGYAVGLFGHGGAGKSTIALMLAACMSGGIPFAGIPTERRRVLYLAAEDREALLHWRLARICKHLELDMTKLAGWLNIIDAVGRDSVLWERDPKTGVAETAAYSELAARMRTTGAEVLIIDGISDVFAGNENARGDVKRFINSMVALVPPATGFVLLLGHVAKPTAASSGTGEGYSGSTAWHNSVRARWYLFPETVEGEDGGRPERTGRLRLELQKSNLGRTDQAVTWRWDDEAHLFVPEAAPTAFDRNHQDREEQRGIRLALHACASAGIAVPAATTGRRTAYHVLTAQPACPDTLRAGKPSVRRFWAQIEKLRAMGHVREDSIRRADYHRVTTLALTDEGIRACGE